MLSPNVFRVEGPALRVGQLPVLFNRIPRESCAKPAPKPLIPIGYATGFWSLEVLRRNRLQQRWNPLAGDSGCASWGKGKICTAKSAPVEEVWQAGEGRKSRSTM